MMERFAYLARKLAHPSLVFFYVCSGLFPGFLWNRYFKKSSKSGISQGTFILSFDCDTDLDIEVIPAVYQKLKALGIHPMLAVPGELIVRGQAVYAALANDGAKFINHGFVQHTSVTLPERLYESHFFYETLSPTEIREDIERGDRTIRDYLGQSPDTFRTPHFGTYQSRKNLAYLHNLLSEFNYKYSSSTLPKVGFQRGPIYISHGITEFPVSGCPSHPNTVLDTWGFAFNPHRKVDKSDYLSEIRKLKRFLENGKPVVVNLYADPSQVYDWPEFFDAMAEIAKYNLSSFGNALDRVGL